MENEAQDLIQTERIDDSVLLISVMKQLGLPALIDRHLPRHPLETGLSWGWVIVLWLAYILSQGDHRKVKLQAWAQTRRQTLETLIEQPLKESELNDDRLTIALKRLSENSHWEALETELSTQTVRVYDLDGDTVRLDATTISGYHAESEMMRFGHSKDDPTLRQIKLALATLDPLGLPLVSLLVSGNEADDPLYIPLVERVVTMLDRKGLLFVGDKKMSALATRAAIVKHQQTYLTPLARVGHTARDWETWIAAALKSSDQIAILSINGDEVIARGYEFSRDQRFALSDETDEEQEWVERVLVVQSLAHAQRQSQVLQTRLIAAEESLRALTPPRARGKRQFQDETALQTAAQALLKRHQVEGLLTYTYEREVEITEHLVGRGRRGPDRPTRIVERVRYQVTAVERNDEAIATAEAALGWQVYVTNATTERLSLTDAVLSYRQQYSIEHGFAQLKGAPLSIAPLFVQRDDQILGLTRLLLLAVHVLLLLQFIVRRDLAKTQDVLTGLYEQNLRQSTALPTAKRILSAFKEITLTVVHLPDQVLCHVPQLNMTQQRILMALGLSPTLYQG